MGYAQDFTEPTFWWEIFALAGDPAVTAHGSTIVGDKYGSPDGLYVAPSGRLWIQTDVSTSPSMPGTYAGSATTRCCAPTRTKGDPPVPRRTETVRDHRLFVTPDERTMFVGIQHPGEPTSELSQPRRPKAVQLLARRGPAVGPDRHAS